jgi:hypothetical protein
MGHNTPPLVTQEHINDLVDCLEHITFTKGLFFIYLLYYITYGKYKYMYKYILTHKTELQNSVPVLTTSTQPSLVQFSPTNDVDAGIT